MWGGRFAGGTNPLVQDYTSSIDADERLILWDVLASMAHAEMLGRQGIIASEEADKIVRALESILNEHDGGPVPLDPALEDVHTNIEALLARKIGPLAGKLHTARSRNDQVATDFRLYVRNACAEASMALAKLRVALAGLAEANIDVIMPGYTHLQRAQPVLFAHHLMAYVNMLARDIRRFGQASLASSELPLGAGALAGVPYNIDREFVREKLNFDEIMSNSIDAVADRDFVVDYIYAATMAMVHVSRLAEEIVLWSSAEFGFITLPDGFATGSSIMPQKKNPDVAELARGRTGHAVGALMSIITTLKGLPLAYNRDMQEDKPTLFLAEDTLMDTLDVLVAMVPEIKVNAARTESAASGGFALATDVADYLVRKGMPFREAHESVGKAVRIAEERGVELSALSLDDVRAISPLFDAEALAIDARASVESRNSFGGTATEQVRERLAEFQEEVKGWLAAMKEFDADAGH